MSDWGAVHSSAKAANNGLDQQSGQELDSKIFFDAPLRADVASGKVGEKRLDDMVVRYLTGIIETGLFDNPVSDKLQPIPYAKNAVVAERAAEAGIVLLKNEGNVLPLAGVKRIVVIGGRADVGVLSGGGSSQVRSVGGVPVEIPLSSGAAASFARITYHNSSPLKALRAAMPGAVITFVDGQDKAAAADAARKADLAIVFATQWATEAQDVPSLSLPYGQDDLIDAVAAAQPKTAVVLETGGPVLMPWLARVPVVVEAWYPGQRGGEAIANILTGKVNPSGRLPITFMATPDQAPRAAPVGLDKRESYPVDYVEGSDVGYRWYEKKKQTPLFPFGYGLSYTNFAYRNLTASGGKTLTVSFDVVNTGKRAGADVPQLYVARDGTSTPMRLAGFQRVTLKPGEARRVTLTAEPRILADFDTALPGWRIKGGTYRVALAHDATDRGMTTTVKVDPATMKP